MFRSVLVVCVGNICRSPVGERLLRARMPELSVGSAGLAALEGHPADAISAAVAEAHGVAMAGHVARQFTPDLGMAAEVILAMEPGHKHEIARIAPHLAGRTLLYDQWTGASGIADPYQRPKEFHEAVFARLAAAADAWAQRLGSKDNR